MKHNNNLVLLTLSAFQVAIIILCNLTASKIALIGNVEITSPIIFFPITYIIGDIITEIYNFKISRIVINLSLVANLIFVILSYIICLLPSSTIWHDQNSFNTVFIISPRIFIASCCAYFIGEYINAYILDKTKKHYKGKYFGYRSIISSLPAVIIDSLVFMFVAFYNLYSITDITELIKNEVAIKIIVEITCLPVTIIITKKLQRYIK